jgi:3-methyladenine DNA glycosylase/8-oxoguanine DNA glycosylase
MMTTLATTLGSRTLPETLPIESCRPVPTITARAYRRHDRLITMAIANAATAALERLVPLTAPLDLRLTLLPLSRGPYDPTIRLAPDRAIRASRTPDGPATIALAIHGDQVDARAWGAGARWALEQLPDLIGLPDDPAAFQPVHPIVRELHRRLVGLRLGRTALVMESLVPAILEQKVTGFEASHARRQLIRRYGERAPGPFDLWLLPPPETLAALPYYAFHPLGVERRRADTIRWAAAHAGRVEQIVDLPLAEATARLRALPGIGPWTTAEVTLRALGDADAVSVGDFHIPSIVAWALAGERKADDARMLELLEPYRGQRGRVIRLLEAGGIAPPRHGPRMSPRSITPI